MAAELRVLDGHKFFERVGDKTFPGIDKPVNSYKLNPQDLSEDLCHIFFPVMLCEESLITAALECFTFPPTVPAMNEKFNINPVKIGDLEIMWCSFPKEFKGVCEKAGRVFGMHMCNTPRSMLWKSTLVTIPSASNILSFNGKRSNDPDRILAQCKDIRALGESWDRLGVD